MTPSRSFPRAPALAALSLCAGPAFAAGGHHAVDDAAILEPGQCEVETWVSRASGNQRNLVAGVNCRVGAVELSAATDHARSPGASDTAWGLQAKWATSIAPGLSIGVAAAPAWQAHARPRYQGLALTGLATWALTEQWALHANLGRDFVHQGPDATRWGAAAEWTSAGGWSLVAERYRADASQFARAGVRWALTDHWSMDVSRAHRLAGPAPSTWTLGASWVFDRRERR